MAALITLIRNQNIDNGIYYVTWSIFNNEITPTFTQLVTEYGEPTINTGGTFTPADPAPDFTLPNNILRIASDLPFTQIFDPANPALSTQYLQDQIATFVSSFETKYATAVNTLKANSDTYTDQALIGF